MLRGRVRLASAGVVAVGAILASASGAHASTPSQATLTPDAHGRGKLTWTGQMSVGTADNGTTDDCFDSNNKPDPLSGCDFFKLTVNTPPGFADPTGLTFPTNLGFSTFDSLTTRNRYYAPQIGADAEFECGGVFFTARGKVAVGVMQQIVDVVGQTTPTGFTLPVGGSASSGLLSSPIDQGRRDRTRVAEPVV